jgi:hypothetical protein
MVIGVIGGKPLRGALGQTKVKLEIARPRVYDRIALNQNYAVIGAA